MSIPKDIEMCIRTAIHLACVNAVEISDLERMIALPPDYIKTDKLISRKAYLEDKARIDKNALIKILDEWFDKEQE